jgi:hypothetical protein
VLYAAESRDCAIFETVFHDIPLTGEDRFLPGARLRGKVHSELSLSATSQLILVELHDPGLLRLGLRPRNLTETNASEYPRTVAWAREFHQQLPWAQGLLWMSARLNTQRCLMLYGDRVDLDSLDAISGPEPLDQSPGFDHVYELGLAAGIEVSEPC